MAVAVDHLRTLARLQGEYARVLRRTDPGAAVPACPGWDVRELTEHLARIHHWAASMARGADQPPIPPAAGLVELYETCAAVLRATLHELPPDHPARTLVGPGPASFWHRRQVHETLVHLADLRSAGRALADLRHTGIDDADAALWADTVDEVATMTYPRQVALDRITAVAAVDLVASDTGDRWRLGEGEPVGTLAAPARTLALLLWHRADLTWDVTIDGDRAAVERTLATAVAP